MVLSWFKTKVVDNGMWFPLLGLLLVLYVFINTMDNVYERLGFETKSSLKVELAQQEQVRELLTTQIEELAKQLRAERELAKIVEDSYLDFDEVNKEVARGFNDSKEDLAEKISEIESDESVPVDRRDKMVARAQIDNLWEMYCNVQQSNCR